MERADIDRVVVVLFAKKQFINTPENVTTVIIAKQ